MIWYDIIRDNDILGTAKIWYGLTEDNMTYQSTT